MLALYLYTGLTGWLSSRIGRLKTFLKKIKKVGRINIIHPTDFLIFSFDREVSQSKVLFQCPRLEERFV